MSVTTGRNYWLSGDDQGDASTDGGIGDLCKMLETTLNSHSLAAGGFTVTITESNVITIAHASLTFLLGWNDPVSSTLDPLIFGFTRGSYSVVSSVTAPNQSQGIWYTDTTRSTDTRDRQPVVGAVAETISGLTRASRLALGKKQRAVGWTLVPQAKSLEEYAAATEPTGAFESAWLNAISKGYGFRIYDDASSRTSSSYGLYRTRVMADPMVRSSAPVRFDVNLEAARAED